MTFRLTTLSSFMLFQNSMTNRNSDTFKYSEQMATNKRINRPSDDPQGTRVVISTREAISKLTQYQQSVEDAGTSLGNSETMLTQMKDLLDKVKNEIALPGETATTSPATRVQFADQVQQMLQQLVDLANTQFNDEYTFAGSSSTTKPFTVDDASNITTVTYAGGTQYRAMRVTDNAQITYQINGESVLKGTDNGSAVPGNVDVFQTLITLEAALRSGNVDKLDPNSVASMIDRLDTATKQVTTEIANIGAKTNRLTMIKNQQADQMESLREVLEMTEGADLTEVVSNFQRANIAMQATIQSSAAIFNLPTLMDFIGK